MGGGTGAPVSIRALLSLGFDTSAVVAMADDGGSTGLLRQLPGITAPGDVRKCLVAFAGDEDPLVARRERLFRMRLNSPGGHVIGNLVLGGLERSRGSFTAAIAACEQLLQAKGHVIPSTLEPVTLAGIDVHGGTVTGQWDICHSVEPMSHVFLKSARVPEANPEALAAIADADLIVLGPGSMFTSILPNLLVPGIADAIIRSRAKVVFVCPLADAQGETRGMDAAAYVDALERHGLAERLDWAIINEPRFGGGARTYIAHDRRLNLNVYSVAYTAEILERLEVRGIHTLLRPLADAERVTWHNPVALRNALLEVTDACHLRQM